MHPGVKSSLVGCIFCALYNSRRINWFSSRCFCRVLFSLTVRILLSNVYTTYNDTIRHAIDDACKNDRKKLTRLFHYRVEKPYANEVITLGIKLICAGDISWSWAFKSETTAISAFSHLLCHHFFAFNRLIYFTFISEQLQTYLLSVITTLLCPAPRNMILDGRFP